MKKTLSRAMLIALVIVLICLLSGCKGGKEASNDKDAEDSFMYQEIIVSDLLGIKNFDSIDLSHKDEIGVYDYDKAELSILGKNEEKAEKIELGRGGRNLFAFSENDDIYMLTQEYERNGDNEIIKIKRQLHIYSQENKEVAYESEIKEIGNSENIKDEIIRKIKIDSTGNMYTLKLNGSIEIFDEKLNNLHKLEKDTYWDMDLDENDNLITLRYTKTYEKILEGMDTKKYSIIWQKEYPKEQGPYMIYYNKDTKTLYGLNRSIISKYDVEKDNISKLLDYSKLSAVEYVDAIAVDKDEVIYICGSFKDESKLFQYIKTDEKPDIKADKIELNFEAVDYLGFLSNAAREFEKEHSDIKINLINTRGIPYEEYRERLNTELMAGKGPDILCGFGYYTKDYMNKGLFVNMDEMIKKDKKFDINDYYLSLIDGSRHNGGLYALPLTYMFECFVVNEGLLNEKGIEIPENWTWKDFYDIAEKIRESSSDRECYMLPKLVNGWMPLYTMIIQDMDYYIDREKKIARFDTQEFMDILKMYRFMESQGLFHPDIDEVSFIESSNRIDTSSILFFLNSGTGIYYESSDWLGEAFKNGFKIIPAPKGIHTGTMFFQGRNIYINKSTKYQDECWEFIKYLLSEEMQKQLAERNDYVINKKADDFALESFRKYQSEHPGEFKHAITDGEIEQIRNVINNALNRSQFYDELGSIIEKELVSFMDNKKSAEETAKGIQNKVQLYLNE